jgi:hypothetical protein
LKVKTLPFHLDTFAFAANANAFRRADHVYQEQR